MSGFILGIFVAWLLDDVARWWGRRTAAPKQEPRPYSLIDAANPDFMLVIVNGKTVARVPKQGIGIVTQPAASSSSERP